LRELKSVLQPNYMLKFPIFTRMFMFMV